ncbi:leucine-rich repeat-containing protein 46 isoform X3 [Anolis carolinensis]|uniref:leucine-rich repeat-containing protein 46 isoform X3 n=1 Tax=Anolis carolinensis TaxID=28377 RepID=UPI002F2B5249
MRSENSQKCSIEGVSLTKSLIARRNLAVPMDDETLENISQALSSLEILRLDRERISHITDLEGLEQIHSIYLQQNQIKKIENLSCLPNLNSCILAIPRERVLAALPLLKELDTKSTPSWNTPVQSKEEDSSEDSDYEEWPGLSRPLSAEKDFFVDLHEEFTSRSARRREEAVKEHEAHLEELKQQQKLRQLIFDTSHDSPKALSTSKLGLPVLEYNMLQTEHHTASNQHLKTENASFSTSAPKKKTEGKNQTQLKNL